MENWIHYSNPKRRKSRGLPGHAYTSPSRPNNDIPKVMLCIWWDQVGVIYYEQWKPNETITGERYRTQLIRLSRALREKRPQYEQSMTTLGLTLPNPLKPTWKRSNRKSYPTRRISQIWRRPIITCSDRWHMVSLTSSSAHIKTSENGLIRG